jgi:uncharacterized BrkB/YihY/UPF0761 family membrane protein
MKLFEHVKRKSFWKEVLKFGTLLMFVFFIIILLLSSSGDIFSGDFSKVFEYNFTGTRAFIFFGSLIVTSFFSSLFLVFYDIEEKMKEQELEQIC